MFTFFKVLHLGITSFQIQKKLQKLLTDKLMSCNLKVILKGKSFFTLKDKLPKCYFQDSFKSICVVAAMLPIMAKSKTSF